MPRFKDKLDGASLLFQAALRRVQDREHETLDPKEADRLARQMLQSGDIAQPPAVVPGQVLSSAQFRKYVKDSKFTVNLLNGQVSLLEEQIGFSNRDSFGTLNDIQQEALALDSSVTEEEARIYGNYTTVHFNSFVRAQDSQLETTDPSWFVDYKTGLPFLPENLSRVIPGSGLTLPVRSSVVIPVVDAYLVSEETDYGDSADPITSSSPRNVFLPGKVFRHVIVKREFDNTGRTYARSAATLAITLVLGAPQLINQLLIKPSGHSTVEIEELSYLNETGEEVTLDSLAVAAETNTLLLFEPVRTRYLKVRFRQSAPVAKGAVVVGDQRVAAINDILAGAGFTSLLDESSEEIQGRVYDFSIEQMEVSLTSYEPIGVFRSQPVEVENPLGLSLDRSIEAIRVSTDLRNYGIDFVAPEGEVLQEAYIGVELKDQLGNLVVKDLIPVPDSTPWQREFITVSGAYSRVKLFPDINHALRRFKVDKIVEFGSYLVITTAEDHGLAATDEIVAMGRADHPFTGTYTVVAVTSATQFWVAADTGSGVYDLTAGEIPYIYIYKVGAEEEPFEVLEDGEVLEIGTDYQISLDRGATWLDDFPFGDDYLDLFVAPRSGDFLVRLTNPKSDRLYWIVYKPERNQFLGTTNKILLKNGRVVFSKSLQGSTGTLTTVLVSRGDSVNQYLTPVTLFYTLKVRENVS